MFIKREELISLIEEVQEALDENQGLLSKHAVIAYMNSSYKKALETSRTFNRVRPFPLTMCCHTEVALKKAIGMAVMLYKGTNNQKDLCDLFCPDHAFNLLGSNSPSSLVERNSVLSLMDKDLTEYTFSHDSFTVAVDAEEFDGLSTNTKNAFNRLYRRTGVYTNTTYENYALCEVGLSVIDLRYIMSCLSFPEVMCLAAILRHMFSMNFVGLDVLLSNKKKTRKFLCDRLGYTAFSCGLLLPDKSSLKTNYALLSFIAAVGAYGFAAISVPEFNMFDANCFSAFVYDGDAVEATIPSLVEVLKSALHKKHKTGKAKVRNSSPQSTFQITNALDDVSQTYWLVQDMRTTGQYGPTINASQTNSFAGFVAQLGTAGSWGELFASSTVSDRTVEDDNLT